MPNTKHVPRMKTNNLDSLNPCFNDTTIAKKQIYYHGTSFECLNSILESKYVGVKYFDGYGFYLTKDIHNAFNHGYYVLCFEDINEHNLITDDVNDGLLYKGILPIESIKSIAISSQYQSIYIENIIKQILITKTQ
jgi:hypothetical protein